MNLALETRESATLRRKDTRPADRPVTDLTLEKREREGFNNYLEGEKIVEITVDSNRVPILPVYYYMIVALSPSRSAGGTLVRLGISSFM